MPVSKVIDKKNINYPYLSEPVSLYTFENGHHLVLAKKESGMINISTWVKTGSINENNDNNGVSHFLEHLMFKGTTKYKAGEFDRVLEGKGGIINAATWKDYTFYYVTIPKASAELAVKLHADMMIDPILPENEIGPTFDVNGQPPAEKRERYVVIEEIRMGQDKSWRKVYDKLNDAMYEAHPYKRNVIGTSEIISSIAQSDIKAYYENFYTPENMTTIVVGDFNEQKMLKLIQGEFQFHKFDCEKKLVRDNNPAEYVIKDPRTILQNTDVKTGYIMFGFLCDSAKNQKETIALDLISTIFGEGKSSRLNRNLIENVDEPYFYYADSCHYQFKEGDNFLVQANFEASKKDDVIAEIKAELTKLASISDNELKKAKKRVKATFAQEAETVSEIADSIGHYMTVVEDLHLASEYLKTLDTIDKSYLEDMAQKYLSSEKCTISVLMPNE